MAASEEVTLEKPDRSGENRLKLFPYLWMTFKKQTQKNAPCFF